MRKIFRGIQHGIYMVCHPLLTLRVFGLVWRAKRIKREMESLRTEWLNEVKPGARTI